MIEFINSLLPTSSTIAKLFNIVITVLISFVLLKLIDRIAKKATKLDKTMSNFFLQAGKMIVYFFAGISIASCLGINTSSLVAFASVISAAFALAAQNVLSNLFGGFSIYASHHFKVGDYVSIDGTDGTVKEIGLFYTTLSTPDNKIITMPNDSIIKAIIINYSIAETRRAEIKVAASYDCKIDDVKAALKEAIEMCPEIKEEPAPFIRVFEYGESAITYIVRVWVPNNSYWDGYYNLLENIKVAFDKNGIEMTYNHLIIHNGK